jgi:RecA/RadA recombinase
LNLFRGGLLGGFVTEIYGESGVGKSQFTHHCMINAMLNPVDKRIMDGKCFYISL